MDVDEKQHSKMRHRLEEERRQDMKAYHFEIDPLSTE